MSNKKTPKRRRRKKTKSTAVLWDTIGQAEIDPTFEGEMMKCVMCGAEQQSDPEVETDWRMLRIDNEKYYVCADEFPPDDASAEEFAKAYKKIGEEILELRKVRFAQPMNN